MAKEKSNTGTSAKKPTAGEMIDAVLKRTANTDSSVSIPPEEEVAEEVAERPVETEVEEAINSTQTSSAAKEEPTEEASIEEDGVTPISGSADRRYGCIVRPCTEFLQEKDIILAWKEYDNADTANREIRLMAQAVYPSDDTLVPIGEPVEFGIIPNDLTHGRVPGRSIGFSGWITKRSTVPNAENGGLCPKDNVGWAEDEVWISVAFDISDQVGNIEFYSNSAGTHKPLIGLGISSALNLHPAPPMKA